MVTRFHNCVLGRHMFSNFQSLCILNYHNKMDIVHLELRKLTDYTNLTSLFLCMYKDGSCNTIHAIMVTINSTLLDTIFYTNLDHMICV